jgi:hypothetical protein
MVENKMDFEDKDVGMTIHQMETDPPLVPATAVVEPSAPIRESTQMELEPPSYEEVISIDKVGQQNEGVQPSWLPPDEDHISVADSKMVASGTTAAVIGFFFLGGPIGAVILGLMAAHASQKEGAAGDIARTVGEIGVSVKEKAKYLNDKHHLVDRSAQAAMKAWEYTKQYDREHHVLDRTAQALAYTWQQLLQFVYEHRLLERAYETITERLHRTSTNHAQDQPRSAQRSDSFQSERIRSFATASTH